MTVPLIVCSCCTINDSCTILHRSLNNVCFVPVYYPEVPMLSQVKADPGDEGKDQLDVANESSDSSKGFNLPDIENLLEESKTEQSQVDTKDSVSNLSIESFYRIFIFKAH